jgi:acetate kinase
MKVLVLNCGSSSLKYQLFNMRDERVMAKGLIERIGLDGPLLTHETDDFHQAKVPVAAPDHKVAIQSVIATLTDSEKGVIDSMGEIRAVGHRVVHGGEKISRSVLIDDHVLKVLEECTELAPLHNPANIMGIEACRSIMPNTPQVGVFDTAFHQTMHRSAYLYAIPYEYYEKYHVRRYGFHGTSHKYVAQRAAELLGKSLENVKIITCHLGNGSSVAAVKYGQSIDTSLGFGTLAGLPMGTRCGDLDPAVIPYLMDKENLTIDQISNVLYKKSGLFGISGVSSDMRDIEREKEAGNPRAAAAIEVFAHAVKRFIGTYTAVMGGVDAIVFTAGIGENAIDLRKMICTDLDYLGTQLDEERNRVRGVEKEISKEGSAVKLFVIPTNEELMIARDTREIALDT